MAGGAEMPEQRGMLEREEMLGRGVVVGRAENRRAIRTFRRVAVFRGLIAPWILCASMGFA